MAELFDDLKRGKLVGHPIHSMLVHFPTALFPVSLLFDILAIITNELSFSAAAVYCIGIGLLSGIVSIFFGALDYSRLPATDPAWNKASLHGLLNTLWLILFAIVFGLRIKQYPQFALATPLEIILSVIGVIGIIYTNYLGGVLVFTYKLGFKEKDREK